MNFAQTYHDWIIWIGDGTGLPDTILHIHAGMAVLLVARFLSRRSLGSFVPFWAVVAAEFFNELMDYLVYGMRWADTSIDVVNTLFWPLVLSIAVAVRPMRASDRPRR